MTMDKSELKQIADEVEKVGKRLIGAAKAKAKMEDTYIKTERRLYAYPILKKNIERYKADIEDIKHEDMGKSADIVLYQTNSGKTPESDLEELRAEKIFTITEKMNRDQKEVDEIELALGYIQDDEYYPLIPMLYFERRRRDEVCQLKHISRATSFRQSCRMVKTVELVLYGADALK